MCLASTPRIPRLCDSLSATLVLVQVGSFALRPPWSLEFVFVVFDEGMPVVVVGSGERVKVDVRRAG